MSVQLKVKAAKVNSNTTGTAVVINYITIDKAVRVKNQLQAGAVKY